MFETILQRVLLSNLGKFINGLDKQNLKLGFWSGDVTIDNISLNPLFIKSLGLPLKMLYSHVGHLSMQVPWKSLGKAPIEVVLEDVFIIIEPVERRAWTIDDYKLVLKRLQMIEKYLEMYTDIDLQEEKAEVSAAPVPEQKSKGSNLFSKISRKVIDNLQITIKNVHIRFEGVFNELVYACGVTLDEVTSFTANTEWKKDFIDRTKHANKHIPLRRVVEFKSFSLYWTPKVTEIYGSMEPEKINEAMKKQISRDKDLTKYSGEHIGVVSAKIHILHRDEKGKEDTDPTYEIDVKMSPMEMQLNKLQFDELTQLLNLFEKRWRFRAEFLTKKKDEVKALLKKDQKRCIGEFEGMCKRLMEYENKEEWNEGEENLLAIFDDQEDLEKFKLYILGLSEDEISKAVKRVASRLETDRLNKEFEIQAQAEIDQKKEQQHQGWFSRWFSKDKKKETKPQDTFFAAEEVQEMEKYLKDGTESKEGSVISNETDPRSLMDFEEDKQIILINLMSESGSICLTDTGTSANEDAITIGFKGLSLKLKKDFERISTHVTMQDFNALFKTKLEENGVYTEVPVIRRFNHWEPVSSTKEVFSMVYDSFTRSEGPIKVPEIECSGLEVIWRPRLIGYSIRFWNNFMKTRRDVSALDEFEMMMRMRDEAKDNLDARLGIKGHKQALSVKMESSVIMLPFSGNPAEDSECWVLSLDHLSFDQMIDEEKVSRANKQGENIEIIEIGEDDKVNLKKVKIEYWPSQGLFDKRNQSRKMKKEGGLNMQEKELMKEVLELVEEVDIGLSIEKTFEEGDDDDVKREPIWNVEVGIDRISSRITPEILTKILSIGQIFSKEARKEIHPLLEERKGRKENAVSVGGNGGKVDYSKVIAMVSVHLGHFEANMLEKGGRRLFGTYAKDLNVSIEKLHSMLRVNFQANTVEISGYSDEEGLDTREYKLMTNRSLGISSLNNLDDVRRRKSSNMSEKGNNVEVQVIQVSKSHPEYDKHTGDIQITSSLEHLELNFKPDMIQKIVGTLKDIVILDTEKYLPLEKMKGQEIQHKLDLDHVIVNSRVSFKEVSIKLLHLNLPICLGEIYLEETQVVILEKELLTEVKALVDNVNLIDTTNYPYTLTKNIEKGNLDLDRIEPFVIFETDSQKMIKKNFELRICKYINGHPHADYQNKIFSFLDIKVHHPRFEYVQQMFDRLIGGYLTEQFIPAILGELCLESLRSNKGEVVTIESLLQKLERYDFVSVNVEVSEPRIFIRPYPKAKECLELELEKVVVANDLVKDGGRLSAEFNSIFGSVFCEKYDVSIQKAKIYNRMDKDQLKELTMKEFDAELSVSKPLYMKYYKKLIKNEGGILDGSLNVDMKFNSGICLNWDHEDYVTLMRCIECNLAYDDKHSGYFNGDKKGSSGGSEPVRVGIKFEHWDLILRSNKAQFARLYLKAVDLGVNKKENGRIEMHINGENLEANYFKQLKKEGKIVEKSFIGWDQKERKDIKVKLMMKEEEAKKIRMKIDVENLRGYFVWPVIQRFIQFFDVREDLKLPKKKKAQSIDIGAGEEDGTERVSQNHQIIQNEGIERKPDVTVEIEAKKYMLILPIAKKGQCQDSFVATGDILCRYKGYKQGNRESQNLILFNSVDIEIRDTSVFIANIQDLKGQRKEFLLPSSLDYSISTYKGFNKEKESFYSHMKNSAKVNELAVAVSLEDVVLVSNQILGYQKKIEDDLARREAGNNHQAGRQASGSTEISPRDLKINSTDGKLKVEEFHIEGSQNIQIVLLVRDGGYLAPALRLGIYDLASDVRIEGDQKKIDGKLIFDCGYYNPDTLKWSPVIDKFGTQLELEMQESPKIGLKITNLDKFSALNLNLSDQMISLITSIVKNFNTNQEEIVEQPSKSLLRPFEIINETGFPIEFTIIDQNNPSKIHNLESGSSPLPIYLESNFIDLFSKNEESNQFDDLSLNVALLYNDEKLPLSTPIQLLNSQISYYNTLQEDSPYNFNLICHVTQASNKTLIRFTSCIEVYNSLPFPFDLILTFQDHKSEFHVKPNTTFALPVDLTEHSYLSFRPYGPDEKSSKAIAVNELLPEDGAPRKIMEFELSSSVFIVEAKPLHNEIKYCQINILPLVSIKNYCKIPLKYQLSYHNELENEGIISTCVINPQQTTYEFNCSLASEEISLRLKLGESNWSSKQLVFVATDRKNVHKEIKMEDAQGNGLNLGFFSYMGENGNRQVILYSQVCIMNETPYSFALYNVIKNKEWVQLFSQVHGAEEEEEECEEIMNQSITLANQFENLGVKGTFGNDEEAAAEYSGVFNFEKTGNSTLELRKKEDEMHSIEFGVNVNEIVLDKANKLTTKIVTISPRYVVLNRTSFEIELMQPGWHLKPVTIERDVRKPLSQFISPQKPAEQKNEKQQKKKSKPTKNICIRPVDKEEEKPIWCWSGDLNLLDLTTNHFMIQKEGSPHEIKYLKASVTKEKASIFIVIEEEDLEKVPYRVENLCSGVDLSVYQSGSHPSRGLILKPGQIIPWSWRFLNNKKEITVDLITEGAMKHHNDKYKFTFNNLYEPITGEIPVENDQKIKVTAETRIENGIRILRFMDKEEEYIEKNSIVNYDIHLNLEKIALGVTAAVEEKENGGKVRQEILYSKLAGVRLTFVETDEKRFCRLALRSLSLRDNLAHQNSFVKAFGPVNEEMFSKYSRKQFLDLLIVQRYNIQMPYLETVQVFLDQATVNLDSHFIQNICKTFQNIQNSLSKSEMISTTESMIQSGDRQKEDGSDVQQQEWQIVPINKSSEEIFIKDFVIQPLSLNVSLKMNANDFITEDYSFIKKLLFKLGAGLAKLNNVPISAEKAHMINVFGSTDHIVETLGENYAQNLSKVALKWVSLFGVVPSSTGILESLCPGILRMFWFPSFGLFGPQNVARFAGYVSSRTSSVSNTPRFSFSQQSTIVDEKKKIYQGMVVYAHAYDVVEENVKEKKLKGFMLNVSQNPSKPMVKKLEGGELDPIAGEDETEKLLVQSNLMRYKDKSHEYKVRMLDSTSPEEEEKGEKILNKEGFLVIYDMNIQTSKDVGMVGAYYVIGEDENKENAMILVCAHEIVMAWSVKKEKLLWSFEPSHDLEVVEITSRGLQIGLKKPAHNIKDKSLYVSNYDSAQNEAIGKMLKDLKK